MLFFQKLSTLHLSQKAIMKSNSLYNQYRLLNSHIALEGSYTTETSMVRKNARVRLKRWLLLSHNIRCRFLFSKPYPLQIPIYVSQIKLMPLNCPPAFRHSGPTRYVHHLFLLVRELTSPQNALNGTYRQLKICSTQDNLKKPV